MAALTHYLHVYQKPKLGSSFIKRYPVYNYQHTINNMGWFDTASCDIAMRSAGEGADILDNYLGCRVAVYVDNPAQPIWEGLINRITFNAGGASYTISLDEMANRVSVVVTGAANVAAENTPANNTASQAIYGIKQDQIEFGVQAAGSQAGTLRDTILAQRAWPQASITQAQGTTNLVHLELIGLFHTLEWEKIFTATSAATVSFSAAISALITGLANGATFFDNTNTANITANALLSGVQQRGASTWERIQKLAESGDATNYWVCGISPTNRNTGTRVFYYQQANFVQEYTAFQKDSLRPRNAYGQRIPPWLVVPDRAIRVNDSLIGHDTTLLTDPRTVYIQSVQYDANSQSVQWFGADDTTARAAFMLKRSFKPIGRAFGAPTRTLVT